MELYTKHLSESFGTPVVLDNVLDEMAGKGKPGPASAAEKTAKAASDADAVVAHAAAKEKSDQMHKEYKEKYAPEHNAKFASHLHKELTSMGFNKIHDGVRKTIYTAMKPGTESHHTVELTKPSPGEQYGNDHSAIRHTNSGGTSFGGKSHYQPSVVQHWKKSEGQEGSETHEVAEREAVTKSIRDNFTKHDHWDDR
jgi:hypothetical protein